MIPNHTDTEFIPDETLLAEARKLARNSGPVYAQIREELEILDIASKLCCGPIPERSAVWTDKAFQIQGSLRKRVACLRPEKPEGDKS